jgi:multidrug efflux system membrane fusion protein
MSRSIRNRAIALTTVAVIALSGAGFAFHEFSHASAQPTPPMVNPAVPVSVRTVHPGDVTIWSEFSGRLNAVDYAEIRPEVSGRITEVRFRDGQNVKAGTVLFVIDPRPYEAALAKAQANVATARTKRICQTGFDAPRLSSRHGSRSAYDERANRSAWPTPLFLAQAELKQAELNLDYASSSADLGRLSHVEITLGNRRAAPRCTSADVDRFE